LGFEVGSDFITEIAKVAELTKLARDTRALFVSFVHFF
jgi:hypothetical protein